MFECTDFSLADLTDVNFTNTRISGAKFIKSIMEGVKLNILPDLLGHGNYITSVNISPDGNYIVSSSNDKSIKIWDI